MFTVEGRFVWKALPEVLPLPAAVARVALTVSGQRIALPRRADDGGVWLRADGEAATDVAETDSLEAHVSRLVQDGIPLRVVTQLALRVGGRPREVRFASPLLAGGELLQLNAGELSARFELSGALVVEVRSGSYVIELTARHAASEGLRLEAQAEPWPADEVWAWMPDIALRQASVSGGSAVDPAQTRLPPAWREFATYKLRAPANFNLKTERRGQAEAPPNRLRLSRSLIVDFGGDGYTLVDHLQGNMARDWRLSFRGGEQLGNVVALGRDRLITLDADRAGVELRDGEVQMDAVSRGLGAPVELSAVGWDADVDQLSIAVRLPARWSLLWASGADHISDLPFSDWAAVDWLAVVMLALAVGWLCGWVWTPLALVAFVLAQEAHHSAWWAWGPLLASLVVMRRAPSARWRETARVVRSASACLLAYALVVFAADQASWLVFPNSFRERAHTAQRESHEEAAAASAVATVSADAKEGGTGTRAYGAEGSKGPPTEQWEKDSDGVAPPRARLAQAPTAAEPPTLPTATQDPQAVVQTGPGVPEWSFRQHELSWVGPVNRDHRVRLWLLTPLYNGLIALLSVALSVLVAVVLLRAPTEPPPEKPRRRPAARAAAAGVAFLMSMVVVAPSARAEPPSKELLADLKARLIRPPACEPSCVAVSKLTAAIENNQLNLRAEVDVGALAAYQLPGPAKSWVPSSVLVDGQPTGALLTLNGHLHLRLPAGHHRVELSGPMPGAELTLVLGTAPHRMVIEPGEWTADGVDEEGHVGDSIRFQRAAIDVPPEGPGDDRPATEPFGLAPWLEVSRVLEIGVSWTVRTNVKRVSAVGSPVVVKIPLLEGEQLTEGSAKQEGRAVVVSLTPEAVSASYVTALTPAAEVELVAPNNQPWSEVWTLHCSDVWRCSFDGIAPVEHLENDRWSPVFRPWPSETVSFSFAKPPAAEGNTVTVIAADLTLDVADRGTQAQLRVDIHTSIGGSHTLTVPKGVRVDSLTVDGAAQPVAGDGGALAVTLRPGRQTIRCAWQAPNGIGMFFRSPEVAVGDQMVNARVTLDIPRNVWLLYAHGPGMGPDIQFWGYLALLVALGLAVGRLPNNPLAPWQWLVLALGLTQLPVAFALVIGTWFFVIAHKPSWSLSTNAHNAVQLVVGAWTLAFAASLLSAMYLGVVAAPNMMVANNGGGSLSWYVDRTTTTLPQPWVLSTTPWLWHLLMTAWSGWVLLLLYRWAGRAWSSFGHGGLWKSDPRPSPPASAMRASAAVASSAVARPPAPPTDPDAGTSP